MDDETKIEKDMTPKLIGETYMKYPTEISQRRYRYGLYECAYCGKEFEATTKAIKKGHTKSCGCLVGKNMTHGLTQHRFYQTWRNMIVRCTNPKDRGYKNYGGRGVTVCDEWLDVRNFITWCDLMHPNITGVSLDRIDVDGNYEPSNCRWADASTQSLNQRISKNNTTGFVGVEFRPSENKYVARISILGDRVYVGYFNSVQEAALARDNYIIENKLPHKLSTYYKKEN